MEKRPLIVGIVNATPDSFSDGNSFSLQDRVAFSLKLIDDGADYLDVGGESTRPGAVPVSVDEELSRVIPLIQAIKKERPLVQISIDTTKSEVARQALMAGAFLVNDVSALRFDPQMASVVAEFDASLVLMHSRGTPQNMMEKTSYVSFLAEIEQELELSLELALKSGVKKDKIILDPGFGFAKTTQQNIFLLQNINYLQRLGYPLYVGLSRKKFLGELIGVDNPADRDTATVMANLWAISQGASYIRVHNVALHAKALFQFLKRN